MKKIHNTKCKHCGKPQKRYIIHRGVTCTECRNKQASLGYYKNKKKLLNTNT